MTWWGVARHQNRTPRIMLVFCAAAFVVAATGAGAAGTTMHAAATPLIEHDLVADDRAWLTPALAARLASGETIPLDEVPGFPYDPVVLQELGDLGIPTPYTHIRPGAALGFTQAACTANFVFANGDRLGIGTAGHCITVGSFQGTYLVTDGGLSFHVFGRVIFSTGDAGIGTDFALIEIFPESHALTHAAMTLVDGPCGMTPLPSGSPMHQYGHGLAWGAGGQARHGVSLTGSSGNSVNVALAPGIAWGDSGSPARFATGPAAGVITHGLPLTPYGAATTMERALQLLANAGHHGWSLVDSPNC